MRINIGPESVWSWGDSVVTRVAQPIKKKVFFTDRIVTYSKYETYKITDKASSR